MANLRAIHSVGASLITYLRNSYPEDLRQAHSCKFTLLSSGELEEGGISETTLSLLLYRVSINEHLRNVTRGPDVRNGVPPLALDLHYLLTVWADTALKEQTILAWAMRELYHHSMLDTSSLSSEANWQAGDVVQVLPTDLTNDDIMRIWDALPPAYRLSVSYVARVVRIDPDVGEDMAPVVATRYGFGQKNDREEVVR